MLRAGDLRNRITIERPVEVRGDSGSVVKDWQPIPYATVWSARTDLSGAELYQAQQINARVSTRFTIRHRNGLDARMRVISDGVPYAIESVQDPEGRREFLVLLCSRSSN